MKVKVKYRKMKQGFFITGTDTGVGKTWATIALINYFKMRGETVVGMKPIASGCEIIKGVLKNEDALLLQEHASVILDYQQINSYSFLEPVSPHLAANNECVDLDKINEDFNYLKTQADIVLVEGVGGWLVPLNNQGDDVEMLAKKLQLPVIMVVGIRLGCINHALLSMAHLSHIDRQPAWIIINNCDGKQNTSSIKKALLPYMSDDSTMLECGYHQPENLSPLITYLQTFLTKKNI